MEKALKNWMNDHLVVIAPDSMGKAEADKFKEKVKEKVADELKGEKNGISPKG